VKRGWRIVATLLTLVGDGHSGSAADLGGRYVLSQRTVVVAPIPILPDLSSETWSVALVDLSPSSGRLSGEGRLCHIEMRSSSSLVRTELPPGLRRLLSDVRLDARLTPRPDGVSLSEVPRVRVLGAKLVDPARDDLPRDVADPRIFDHDGDGHPGVTVRVRGIVNGDVYVVQRGSAALEGESDPFGFHGAVRFKTDDVVVGATKSVLMRRSKTLPDRARSTFVLRKVDAAVDCDRALALARQVH